MLANKSTTIEIKTKKGDLFDLEISFRMDAFHPNFGKLFLKVQIVFHVLRAILYPTNEQLCDCSVNIGNTEPSKHGCVPKKLILQK